MKELDAAIESMINYWNSNIHRNPTNFVVADLKICFSIYKRKKISHEYFYNAMKEHLINYVENLDKQQNEIKIIEEIYPDSSYTHTHIYTHPLHCELLKLIHEDNEELSMKLMQQYPKAYKMIDEPWAKWTKIIL